jgi:hypothetical protein
MPEFTRFTKAMEKKQKKRIVSITVEYLVSDSTGTIGFTDLMLQEGNKLSGYVSHTDALLKKCSGENDVTGKRFYNGLVRSNADCIIFNLGSTAAGLDYKIYPNQNMKSGSISLSSEPVHIKQSSKLPPTPGMNLTSLLLPVSV